MKFMVDNKPFLPMGGQANNSSAYNADELASAIAGVKAINGNALESPVYWEQVEPVEGTFDFTSVDVMLEACRNHGLRLILLWFATWKNGEMRYCPQWVKQDTARFYRVKRSDGTPMNVLSAFCEEAQQADARAFEALMGHLRGVDGSTRTVIAVQVENEPGILGCDRDYGAEAEAALNAPVPEDLVDVLRSLDDGPVWQAWKANGFKENGTWRETFGLAGGECCTAWSIARYIDGVAAQGKAVYDLPMFVNVWLPYAGWPIPGCYPSGGAVHRTLEIWKRFAPHIDLFAPDIYIENSNVYQTVCEDYRRPDNPLFVPESGANDRNAKNMLRALADYDAIGYFVFAIDSILDAEGNIRESAKLFAESFRSVMQLLPLLRTFSGSGRVHAVAEEEYLMNQTFEFEAYIGMVPFRTIGKYTENKDHRYVSNPQLSLGRSKHGLILEAGPKEFYLAGDFHLFMVPKASPQWNDARLPMNATPVDYLSVEEGTLTEDGKFVPERVRNGDEVVFGGFWVTPHCGVVRIRLT